jgi:hypothetical protein
MLFPCPQCLSYRTQPEPCRWYERPLQLLLVQPYRCRHCDHRFLRFREPDLPLFLSQRRHLAAK